MASLYNSQVVIKDKVSRLWNVLPSYELHDRFPDETDSYEDLKLMCFGAIKAEETETFVPLPEQCLTDITSGTVQPATLDPCPNPSTYRTKWHRITTHKFPAHDMLMVKKLLQWTFPKKHVNSRWTKQTTESILRFLESFVTFARSCRLTNCGDKCLALKGPRILKCDVCLCEFSGLYDRYLKLFIHYKTDHKLKCNTLIGRKWNKLKATLDIMVKAWKMDLQYELQNVPRFCMH